MNPQKIFWAQNLKVLRNKRKLSQEFLAEQLSMSRSKYNAHENGQTTNPPVDDLLRISDYFKLSIDTLLRVDLSKLSISKIKELEAGNDAYQAGTQLRVLAISVDKDNKENLEYVPVKAKAGYRSGYNDPEFIAALPRFSLPNLPDNGSYRMFPTTGDSMLPIPENSDVIARFVQNWQQLKPRSLCIVILKGEQDFVFKQVTLEADGVLLLESLNRTYQPYQVAVADVLEIWQYHSYQTGAIPEPETDMQMMAKAIKEMQQAIQGLKKK